MQSPKSYQDDQKFVPWTIYFESRDWLHDQHSPPLTELSLDRPIGQGPVCWTLYGQKIRDEFLASDQYHEYFDPSLNGRPVQLDNFVHQNLVVNRKTFKCFSIRSVHMDSRKTI